MNKIYILTALILLNLNIVAFLDKFIYEHNIHISITDQPNSIDRMIFIKYCLNQYGCNFKNKKSKDYISERTIKSLTDSSKNQSYMDIDLTLLIAMRNYRCNKTSRYCEFIDAVNFFSSKSSIERNLLKAFKINPIKLFLEEHAPEIIVSSAIATVLSLFAYKYFKKNQKPRLNLQPIRIIERRHNLENVAISRKAVGIPVPKPEPVAMPNPIPVPSPEPVLDHIIPSHPQLTNHANTSQKYTSSSGKSKVAAEIEECSICTVDLNEGGTCRCSNNHEFHFECMKTWIKHNPTCPICRDRFILPVRATFNRKKNINQDISIEKLLWKGFERSNKLR